jgi:hydroxyquinol 1,2-dioxygenase
VTSDLSGASLTDEVVRSFANTPDERLKTILSSLTRHLHGFVSEVEPTIAEWTGAIQFLTDTGHASTDNRQEFILLSDVLGISMLVETINDQEVPDATDSTVLGPFHIVESPPRELGADISPESTGTPCVVSGRVVSTEGRPIPHATIDLWQANADGFYDVQQPGIQTEGNGRGLIRCDDAGRFWFTSVIPSYYPIPTDGPVGQLLRATRRHPNRPAHIHFLVSAPGFREVTTHIFVAGSPYIDSDAVFAVKSSLIQEFELDSDPGRAASYGLIAPFRRAQFDIVLSPE